MTTAANVDEWIDLLNSCSRKTIDGILEFAAICANPPDGVDDKVIKSKADRLRFKPATVSKYATIGKAASWLRKDEIVVHLPEEYTILYVLSKKGEAKVTAGIESGIVNPKMSRADAEGLGGTKPTTSKNTKPLLNKSLLAAIKRPAQMEEKRLAELSRAIDELGDRFGVEVIHSASDAVRTAETLWRKRAQQAIERAKKRKGDTWTLSDEECVIGRNNSPEEAQALLDKIGIRIVVRTLIEQAYATEGLEPPALDAPLAAKNDKAA